MSAAQTGDGATVGQPAAPSLSVTELEQLSLWLARNIRHQAVQLDLVLDHLTRAEAGLSRGEVVELRDRLEVITAALSEVAGTV